MDIALVGIGKIALDQHVPALEASSDFTLAATISRAGSVPGVPAYTDFTTFLAERPEVGVVSLCLPPVPRYDYAAAALDAGRHVMLEKPPGATLAECHALARMAQDRGLTLFATWHSREAAMVEPARQWLADRTLRAVHITWREDVRRWHPGQKWIWQPGGLGVFDPGINALSIVTEILPTAMHLTRATLKIPENRQTPIAADLTFAAGDAPVRADFDWRHTGDQTWRIEVETDAGTLTLDDGGARMSVDGAASPATGDALAGEYPSLYARMAHLLKTGTSDTDFSPLTHVADAFLLGAPEIVAPFHDKEAP